MFVTLMCAPGAVALAQLTYEPTEALADFDGGFVEMQAVRTGTESGEGSSPPPAATESLTLGNTIEGFNFDTNSANTGFLFIPPDPSGASGPGQVVSVGNVTIQWHTKPGLLQNNQSLASFFAPLNPTTFTFDPKVIYDQHAGRFVVVTLERVVAAVGNDPSNVSRILLAVSDDSDPNGTWFFQAINAKTVIGGLERFADYPGFAVDEEAIYITANMFSFGFNSFGGVRLWIVDKGSGSGGFYDGGASAVTRLNPYAAGGFALTTQPAHVFGAAGAGAGVGTFLVGYSGLTNGVDEFLQVMRLDNPLTAPTVSGPQFVLMGNIDTSLVALPDAPQPSTAIRIEVNDRRALHAVWRNNSLYATMTVEPPSGPDAGQTTARWVHVDTTNLAALVTADGGNIGGNDIDPGAFTYFPSIAVNGNGDIGFSISLSGPTTFAGHYITCRKAADPPSTVRPTQVVAAGQDFYFRRFNGTRNRWGDYSGMSVDPVDDLTFWAFNQYASTRGTPTSGGQDGRWATRWASFQCNHPPAVTTSLGCNEIAVVKVGETLSFEVIATDPDSGDVLTLNVSDLPDGATMTPALPSDGTQPLSSTFTWTPDKKDGGFHFLTFFVLDDHGAVDVCSVTIEVGIVITFDHHPDFVPLFDYGLVDGAWCGVDFGNGQWATWGGQCGACFGPLIFPNFRNVLDFKFLHPSILRSIDVSTWADPGMLTLTGLDDGGNVVETFGPAVITNDECTTIETGWTEKVRTVVFNYSKGGDLAVDNICFTPCIERTTIDFENFAPGTPIVHQIPEIYVANGAIATDPVNLSPVFPIFLDIDSNGRNSLFNPECTAPIVIEFLHMVNEVQFLASAFAGSLAVRSFNEHGTLLFTEHFDFGGDGAVELPIQLQGVRISRLEIEYHAAANPLLEFVSFAIDDLCFVTDMDQ